MDLGLKPNFTIDSVTLDKLSVVSLLHWWGDLRAREEMPAPGSLRGRQKSGDQNTNSCLFIQRSVRESPGLPGVNKGGTAGRAE